MSRQMAIRQTHTNGQPGSRVSPFVNRMAAVAFTSFCLAIGIHAGVSISTPPVGPTSRTVGWPSLAPVRDGFLAFCPEDYHTLHAVALDKTGRPRACNIALAPPASAFTKPLLGSD